MQQISPVILTDGVAAIRQGASCWSMRWFLGAAVEPERPGLYRADPEQSGRCPGVCGETCPYFVLICGLDGVQGLLAVTNRAAEDKKAIVDEPVHECRVPGPALLVADLARGVPAWPWTSRTAKLAMPAAYGPSPTFRP